MKRLFFTCVVALMCIVTTRAQYLQRSPQTWQLEAQGNKAPGSKVLGVNQLYMGSYTTDALAEYGLGLPAYPDNATKVATLLPIDRVQSYSGSTIKAIRVGLCAPITHGAVFIYPVTSLNPLTLGNPIVNQTITQATSAGWNTIELNQSVTLNTTGLKGLLLGYQYAQKNTQSAGAYTIDCYPISVVSEGLPLDDYVLNASLTGGNWQDIGLSAYGNLSIQAIVENQNFPEHQLQMADLSTHPYARITQGLNYRVALSNFGTATLDNYAIDVLVDGQRKTTITSPMTLQLDHTYYEGHCPLGGVTVGQHTLTLRVTAVNGKAVTGGAEVSTTFVAYGQTFARHKQLIELFTAQGAPFAARGEAVAQAMTQLRGDVEWVSIHNNYNGTDSYTFAKATSLADYVGCTAYPSAMFNRFDATFADNLMQDMAYQLPYAQQVATQFVGQFFEGNTTPALATVNIEPAYDDATRRLSIKVSGQLSSEFTSVYGSNMGLTVYVTEDSLVSRQLVEGSWNSNYVHRHVLRSMPTAYNGDYINVTGTSYSRTYQLTVGNNWNPQRMRVVALVHRRGSEGTMDKEVINCQGVPLTGGTVDTLPGDVTGDGQVDIADVNAVIDIMLGKAAPTGSADVTADGEVDIADVNALIDLMLGKQ